MISSTTNAPGSRSKSRVGLALAALAIAGFVLGTSSDTLAQQPVQQGTPQQMQDPGAMSLMEQPQASNLPDQWQDDLEEAKTLAREEDKHVLAMFSAAWSAPCQALMSDVFPSPQVTSELEDWVPVLLDADQQSELLTEHQVQSLPTFVVLDADGEERGRFVGGAPTPESFLMRLEAAVDYEDKLAAAEDAVSENPRDAKALHRLGDLQIAGATDDNSFMKAVETYKKALIADPADQGNIEPSLASVLNQSVEKEKEITAVSEEIKQKPEDPTLYKKRADLRTEDPLAQDPSTAIADYRQAASLDPENETGAAGDLAFFEAQASLQNGQGDPTQVSTQLQEFETEFSNHERVPESMILRAYIGLQTGQIEQATTVLQSVVTEHPTHEAAEAAGQLLSQIAASMQQQQQQQMQQQQQQGAPQQNSPPPAAPRMQ